MNYAIVAGALAIGLLIGIVSGLIGIGGGVLVIPALMYCFGMSQIRAQGTSIAILLLPIGIFAFLSYYRAGQVDVKLAALIAVGFAIGGWLGGSWAQHLPELVLKRSFAALLILIAAKLIFSH